MEATVARAQQLLCWTHGEGNDDARRGHVYLHRDGERVNLYFFEHLVDRDPAAHKVMMDRHAEWTRSHPPTPTQALRRGFNWRAPGGTWAFYGDLGGAHELLGDRPIEVVLGPGVCALPSLPTSFLRRPVTSLIELAVGPVTWPQRLEAMEVCVGAWPILGLRHGSRVLVCAGRYGSKFASAGQNRTAAIWRSDDDGRGWSELPWTIEPSLRQRVTRSHVHCWPPEQVHRMDERDGLTIEWEDPWIDWEPGTQWQASWSAALERWTMRPRPGGDTWP